MGQTVNLLAYAFGGSNPSLPTQGFERKFADFSCKPSGETNLFDLSRGAAENAEFRRNAEIAQLVEHNLAKVGVASSSLVFRSKFFNIMVR